MGSGVHPILSELCSSGTCWPVGYRVEFGAAIRGGEVDENAQNTAAR